MSKNYHLSTPGLALKAAGGVVDEQLLLRIVHPGMDGLTDRRRGNRGMQVRPRWIGSFKRRGARLELRRIDRKNAQTDTEEPSPWRLETACDTS